MLLKELSIKNKGFYGIGASACSYNSSFPQYIRITDIDDFGRYRPSEIVCINPVVYPEFKKYFLHENDIVFARTGNSTGRNYFYNKKDGDLVYAGFLIKFTINEKLVNPRYIKYYCQSQKYMSWISSSCTGSTRNNINAQLFSNLDIFINSPAEQCHIVNTR